MKKIILILMFLFTSLFLTSCRQTSNDINLFIYNNEDPFVYLFSNNIIDYSKSKFQIKMSDAKNSQFLQNEQIKEALITDSPIYIINPVDRLMVYNLIKMGKEKDIPLIFFNREPLREDLNLYEKAYYVGADASQSASMQIQLLDSLFKDGDYLHKFDKNKNGTIEILILKGQQGHQDAEKRTETVFDELRKRKYNIHIKVLDGEWEKEKGYELVNKYIIEGNNIELIISNNDAMALGAIDALKLNNYFLDNNHDGMLNQNDSSWIPVLGIDGLDEAITAIDEGYMYGTVLNDAKIMAEAIVDLVDALLNKADLNQLKYKITDGKYIWINYKVYSKDMSE